MDWLRLRKRTLLEDLDRDTDASLARERLREPGADPEAERRVRYQRRALVLLLAGLSGAGGVAAFIGEGGLSDMLRLRREIDGLQRQIDTRGAEVSRLRQAVWGLEHETIARERVAREQLGLVRPGEIDFLLPRQGEADWESELLVDPD